MKRIFYMLKKEIVDARSNLPFLIIVIISPLMFLVFWILALAQEITLPVTVKSVKNGSSFVNHIENYKTPFGIKYFDVSRVEHERKNLIYLKNIEMGKNSFTMNIDHELKSIDLNMTKDFRNRLTGSTTSFLEKQYLKNRSIKIKEITEHKKDILWKNYFAASLMVMGILMGGLLYGALSISSEWTSGTITFLSVSPVSPWWILISKEVAAMCKGLVGSMIFVLVAWVIVPDLMMPLGQVFLMSCAGYIVFVLAGMIVGITVKDPIMCFLISLIGSLALWLLGNGFGTMAIMGSVTGFITGINPATYIMAIAQHYINDIPVNWINIFKALGIWITALQLIVFALYYKRIYSQGGRRV